MPLALDLQQALVTHLQKDYPLTSLAVAKATPTKRGSSFYLAFSLKQRAARKTVVNARVLIAEVLHEVSSDPPRLRIT